MIAAVLIVRTDPTAEASLAAIRERSKFGIAIAAMIKMIATTISNSMSEKPFCFLFIFSPKEQCSESCVVLPAGVHLSKRKVRAKPAHRVYSIGTSQSMSLAFIRVP